MGSALGGLLLTTMMAASWSLADVAPVVSSNPTIANSSLSAPAATDTSLAHTALGDQPLRSGGIESTKLPAGNTPVTARPPSMDYQRVGFALAVVIALIFILRGMGRAFFPSTT